VKARFYLMDGRVLCEERHLDVTPGKTHYGVIDREFRWFLDTGKMSWDGYLELRETEAPEQ
jgi:hypothetical protein